MDEKRKCEFCEEVKTCLIGHKICLTCEVLIEDAAEENPEWHKPPFIK